MKEKQFVEINKNGKLTQFKLVGTFRFNGYRAVAVKDEGARMYHIYFKIPQLNETQCQSYMMETIEKTKGKDELDKIRKFLTKVSKTSVKMREMLNLNPYKQNYSMNYWNDNIQPMLDGKFDYFLTTTVSRIQQVRR